MLARRTLALGGAVLALVLAPGAVALAAGTSVTVRVEGTKRTLLLPKLVHTHAGSITKGGTPAGSCPDTSAAGALDVATNHNWNGSYSQYGLSVTSIFAEHHPLTATSKYYWSIWINHRYASSGICAIHLHRSDQLLFAAVPDQGTVYPTAIRPPKSARTSHPFKLKVVYFDNAGKARPLAHALIHRGKSTTVTNKAGVAMITIPAPGSFAFTASEQGYIRSAPATVRVK